jgi:hypothetical protein
MLHLPKTSNRQGSHKCVTWRHPVISSAWFPLRSAPLHLCSPVQHPASQALRYHKWSDVVRARRVWFAFMIAGLTNTPGFAYTRAHMYALSSIDSRGYFQNDGKFSSPSTMPPTRYLTLAHYQPRAGRGGSNMHQLANFHRFPTHTY